MSKEEKDKLRVDDGALLSTPRTTVVGAYSRA